MLPAIVIASRFLSVSIHILDISQPLDPDSSPRAATNYITPFDTNWPFLRRTMRSPLQRTKKYDIPAKLRTYLHAALNLQL